MASTEDVMTAEVVVKDVVSAQVIDNDTAIAQSLNTQIANSLESLLLGPELQGSHFITSYRLGRKLMSGSYGTVFVGTHNISKREYAVKVIDRSKLSKHDDRAQLREVAILRSLKDESMDQPSKSHPQFGDEDPFAKPDDGKTSKFNNGIINLVDFYPSPTQYHIVLELARGGDVFDRLAKRKVYTEKHARDLAKRMLESICFLNRRGIAHRDIKPENLLLMDEENDTDLKLADFGFARTFSLSNPDSSMKTKCGTPAFVPPEVVTGLPYGPKCDVWSAGCTLFMLLSGRAPFVQDKLNPNAMFYKIRAGDYVFYNNYWSHVSLKARRLVVSMLQVDPKLRVTPQEALRSEWMMTDDDTLRRSSLQPSLREIVSFHARRKLKGAIGAIMYAVGGKFWNIETAAIWRENMYDSVDSTVDENEDEAGVEVTGSPFPAVPPKFYDLYKLSNKIRVGKAATVWEGTSNETQLTYAIKMVNREDLSHAEEARVLNEVAVLKSLRHPHIVPLLDFFEDPQNFYMVMPICDGGNVLDRVASVKRYSEKDARELSKGLLEAVAFMHGRGVAHRDLKPHNLLLENNADNTSIKICDFGYAKRVHMPQSLTTLCGSLYYVAPEVLKNHPYDESVDMWSVGVIIYFLLAGYLPFYSRDQQKLYESIRLGLFRFDNKHWKHTSDEAQTLIQHLLQTDPSNRAKATDALQSYWIQNMDDAVLTKRDLHETQSGIKKEARRLKDVVRAVQWVNKAKTFKASEADLWD